MKTKTYTFPTHVNGTTFQDKSFVIKTGLSADALSPLDLTGADIVMEFKKDSISRAALRFSTADSTIEVPDPTSGEFILTSRIVDLCEGDYISDALVKLADGSVKLLFQAVLPTVKGISTL